jgi:RNA polymerase sigma-70 factor (ECF subfamily)
MPDSELMARVARGDALAYDTLVRRHLPRAFAIARRTCNNTQDAEEAASDAFTKIWVKARDWQPERASFTTWLHRIVVNAALDIARKRRPASSMDAQALERIADSSANVESVLMESEEQARVQAAVAQLTPQQRTAVGLCYFEEYSNAEAAALMGLNVKALEGLLVRARRHLRDLLPTLQKSKRDAA